MTTHRNDLEESFLANEAPWEELIQQKKDEAQKFLKEGKKKEADRLFREIKELRRKLKT